MAQPEVLVVGAGVAGLCCAQHLASAGVDCLVLEATDRVGGRMRTDEVDGFRLDRGFQVLLTAYPECRAMLDYAALDLRPFYSGSLVRHGDRLIRLADPFRHPIDALRSVGAPVGTFGDRLRILRLRARLRRQTIDAIFESAESTTLDALRHEGFSDAMIEGFFRPFFGGIFLERELETSSRMRDFVFKMFAEGDTALPGRGIEAIPKQIASRLPAGSIRTGARAVATEPGRVRLDDGETLAARAVVVATEASSADTLVPRAFAKHARSVACLYYDAPEPPLAEPTLVLDGEGRGPVNNLCVPSQVASGYAPEGRHLVSASVLDGAALPEPDLDAAVRRQLRGWFGTAVEAWVHLRTYRVEQALPARPGGSLEPLRLPVQIERGLFVCGDHRESASIHGAMASGRRAASAVCAELGKPPTGPFSLRGGARDARPSSR